MYFFNRVYRSYMNFTSYEQNNSENQPDFGEMDHASLSSSHQKFKNLGNFPSFGRMDNDVPSTSQHHG